MQVKCSVDLQCDLIKKVLGIAKGLIPNDSLKSYLVRESFLLVIGENTQDYNKGINIQVFYISKKSV